MEFLIKGSDLNSTIVTINLVAHTAKTTKQKILELKKGNLLQKEGPYRLETHNMVIIVKHENVL